jgi:hypothetical protein
MTIIYWLNAHAQYPLIALAAFWTGYGFGMLRGAKLTREEYQRLLALRHGR